MRENTDSSKTYESNVNNDETNLFNESEKPLIQTEKILQRLKTIKMFKQNLLPKAIIQKKPIRQILTTG